VSKVLEESKVLKDIHILRERLTNEMKNMEPEEKVKYWKKMAGEEKKPTIDNRIID